MWEEWEQQYSDYLSLHYNDLSLHETELKSHCIKQWVRTKLSHINRIRIKNKARRKNKAKNKASHIKKRSLYNTLFKTEELQKTYLNVKVNLT